LKQFIAHKHLINIYDQIHHFGFQSQVCVWGDNPSECDNRQGVKITRRDPQKDANDLIPPLLIELKTRSISIYSQHEYQDRVLDCLSRSQSLLDAKEWIHVQLINPKEAKEAKEDESKTKKYNGKRVDLVSRYALDVLPSIVFDPDFPTWRILVTPQIMRTLPDPSYVNPQFANFSLRSGNIL